MSLKLTHHVLSRCDERAIPVEALDLIVRYGVEAKAARGAIQVRFDSWAVHSANEDGVPIGTLRRLRGVVLIIDGEAAVTAWREHLRPVPDHPMGRRLQRREGRVVCREAAALEPTDIDDGGGLS